MELKQVSFVERSSLSRRVPHRKFHCILTSARIWDTHVTEDLHHETMVSVEPDCRHLLHGDVLI